MLQSVDRGYRTEQNVIIQLSFLALIFRYMRARIVYHPCFCTAKIYLFCVLSLLLNKPI
jgi:hypothetical protein